MQTCLWQALDKQTDGDWTGVTSNQLSDQVQIAFAAFCFFFFSGATHEEDGTGFSTLCQGAWATLPAQPALSPCTGSSWCHWDLTTQLESQGQLDSMPSITVSLWCGLSDHYGSATVGLLRPLFFISFVTFRCFTATGQRLRHSSIPSAASIPICSRSPVANHHGMSCPQGHVSFLAFFN